MLTGIEVNEVRLQERGVELRVGPFWFNAEASARDIETLMELDDTATVASHLEWTEAGPSLYVFSSTARRDLFASLRLIDGIGAQTALAIVGVGDTHDILRAAAGGDQRYFCQVPGIGPKRALSVIGGVERAGGRSLPPPVGAPMREFVAAREALTQDGLTETVAEALLGAVIDTAAEGFSQLTAERLLTRAQELRDAG